MNSAVNQKQEESWNYTLLLEPIPITEQVWPEGTKPLVCTRTMTYNHENYIRECIEGILMQKTTFPVRVCIHDDASTDKTAEIVREYQEKYPNLIWAYYQEENTFRHPKRNEMRSEFMGWAEEGKYIALCEGDDYWTDDKKIQLQTSFLENNKEFVLTYHAWRNMDIHGKLLSQKSSPMTLTLLFRNIFGDYPMSLKKAPNGDSALRSFLKRKGEFKNLDSIGCAIRRMHDGGLMSMKKEIDIIDRRIKTHQVIYETFNDPISLEKVNSFKMRKHILLYKKYKLFHKSGLLNLLLGLSIALRKKMIRRFISEFYRLKL
ncbi:MAG: glycosyltransferase [Balneolales bacterium]|nr:glycosyltransferase [Balneolales bacterium]